MTRTYILKVKGDDVLDCKSRGLARKGVQTVVTVVKGSVAMNSRLARPIEHEQRTKFLRCFFIVRPQNWECPQNCFESISF